MIFFSCLGKCSCVMVLGVFSISSAVALYKVCRKSEISLICHTLISRVPYFWASCRTSGQIRDCRIRLCNHHLNQMISPGTSLTHYSFHIFFMAIPGRAQEITIQGLQFLDVFQQIGPATTSKFLLMFSKSGIMEGCDIYFAYQSIQSCQVSD